MDSSVDVCDLMIRLLCAECPDRACAEDDGQGDGPWSHSKLMDCIKKDFREKADKIEAIKNHRQKLVDEITGDDNPFKGGGWIKFTTEHGDQLEKWFDELWKILEAKT